VEDERKEGSGKVEEGTRVGGMDGEEGPEMVLRSKWTRPQGEILKRTRG